MPSMKSKVASAHNHNQFPRVITERPVPLLKVSFTSMFNY
jgi:hypothetical protein